jgi:hypothetical protein
MRGRFVEGRDPVIDSLRLGRLRNRLDSRLRRRRGRVFHRGRCEAPAESDRRRCRAIGRGPDEWWDKTENRNDQEDADANLAGQHARSVH